MPFKIQPPLDLPKVLLDEYFEVEKEYINATQIQDPAYLEKSFKQWELLVNKITYQQPKNIRYHKGGEYHNMGACKYYTLQTLDAFHYILLAYIEDLLSLDLDSANITPAGKTLRSFNLDGNDFILIQNCVEQMIKNNGIIQDPKIVIKQLLKLTAYVDLIKKVKKKTILIKIGLDRPISHIPGEWEKRVFIGGDYESIYLLDSIILNVREFGFEPIIAMEFKSNEENIHHDAMLLLHNCKFAIFDVSNKGGHLMEVERTLDYGTDTLFVCNNTRVSHFDVI